MHEPLLACLDVDYRADMAVAAGIWFRGWAVAQHEAQAVAGFSGVAGYEPGEFYRRELPCLLGVLREGPPADIVIVDGYVSLGEGTRAWAPTCTRRSIARCRWSASRRPHTAARPKPSRCVAARAARRCS